MTAEDLINAAWRLAGKVAPGVSVSGEIQDAGYDALKDYMGELASEGLVIPTESLVSHALDGSTSYTIGSGATIDTARPEQILGGFVRHSNNRDTALDIVGELEYRRIYDKTNSATYPYVLWYSAGGSTTGTIYLYPASSTGTLWITVLAPFAEPTTVTSTLTIPRPYDNPIKWNLACQLFVETYKEDPPAYMQRRAERGLSMLKSANMAKRAQAVDLEIPSEARGGHWNIYTGRYDR